MNSEAGKFQLSKSNKIFVTTIIVFVTVGYFTYATITPYSLGRYTGAVLGAFLIPYLFGRLAWRFSRRDKVKSSSLSFNFVLFLLVFGQMSAMGKIAKKNKEIREVVSTKTALTEAINNSDDESLIQSKIQAHQSSMINYILNEANNNTGLDKKLNEVMAMKLQQSYQIQNDWRVAMIEAPALDEFDFSLIQNSDDYGRQMELLNVYILKSKSYKSNLENMVPEFKQQFTAKEKESETFKAYVSGAEAGMADNKMVDLMTLHHEYGEMMRELLTLLGDNQESWRIENEVIVVNDAMIEIVSIMYEEIINKGIEIAELALEIESDAGP